MVGRGVPVRPFIWIQVEPQPVASEVEEAQSNRLIHSPILFRPQRTADAREVVVRGFVVIKIEVWQVYREILTKFFCETRIPLRLVSVHVEKEFALATFFCPPL